jgi:hypothetical protein
MEYFSSKEVPVVESTSKEEKKKGTKTASPNISFDIGMLKYYAIMPPPYI